MPRYYNVHTHLSANEPDCFALQNILSGFETVACDVYCSIGLHPWYLEEAGNVFDILKTAARQTNVLAIGECGLDKAHGADAAVQEHYFRLQIKLANELKKPLIIHCVRAFEEVFQLLKEEQVMVPVIFHGFRKNQQLAERILREEYFLSFGAALLNNPGLQKVLGTTPDQQFFLETDDIALPIKDLYMLATSIRKTDEEAIILQLQKNFKNTFGI